MYYFITTPYTCAIFNKHQVHMQLVTATISFCDC